jgi:sodium-dependent phosphate cotransporter
LEISAWPSIRHNDKFQVVFFLVTGVFLFVTALEGIGYGFKLMFNEWAQIILALVESGVAAYVGLAIGVLATTLMESSSAVIATTMISMAGMVEAGLPLSSAINFGIPMVLGANVGTTAGNTITLLAIRKSTTKEEFNETIPGVLIDSIYKMLSIAIFFPLELLTGFLSKIVTGLGYILFEILNLEEVFAVFENTVIDILIIEPIIKPMGVIFTNTLGPRFSGIIFFTMWFVVVVLAIDYLITRGLKTLIKTDWADRVSSAFQSASKSFIMGFSLTWLVGSSSIGTSLAIPMLATKIVDLDRVYPYLGGCTLATTVDLAQIYGYIAGGLIGLMLGIAHILLNVFSLIIWLFSPLRNIPIKISKKIGELIASKSYSPVLLIIYTVTIFIILPILVIILL